MTRSRGVIIDKGQQDKVSSPGSRWSMTAMRASVRRVTRVFPFVSGNHVDYRQGPGPLPVQIVRTGQRSVVFGFGNGQLELRSFCRPTPTCRTATSW